MRSQVRRMSFRSRRVAWPMRARRGQPRLSAAALIPYVKTGRAAGTRASVIRAIARRRCSAGECASFLSRLLPEAVRVATQARPGVEDHGHVGIVHRALLAADCQRRPR
jgi:hypothetical protein